MRLSWALFVNLKYWYSPVKITNKTHKKIRGNTLNWHWNTNTSLKQSTIKWKFVLCKLEILFFIIFKNLSYKKKLVLILVLWNQQNFRHMILFNGVFTDDSVLGILNELYSKSNVLICLKRKVCLNLNVLT